MAVLPVQRTWTVGEKVTAAMLNDDVRDAVNFFLAAPTCHVYNGAIATATGTSTFMTFASERYDNDGIHSTTANTSRLTCVTAGVYQINAGLTYAGNATGTKRNIIARLNGATYLPFELTVNPDGGTPTPVALSFQWKLAVGDYLELRALHDAGATINVTPEFAMTWQSAG